MSSHAHSRTALITGGRTRIGYAAARLVHSQGNSVPISSGKELTTGRIRLGRFGESTPVAEAAAFPAIPAAGFITGENLGFASGMSAA